MKKIFSNPAQIEKEAKERLGIPDFLMMEHAAQSMANFIINNYPENPDVLILAGKSLTGHGGEGRLRPDFVRGRSAPQSRASGKYFRK